MKTVTIRFWGLIKSLSDGEKQIGRISYNSGARTCFFIWSVIADDPSQIKLVLWSLPGPAEMSPRITYLWKCISPKCIFPVDFYNLYLNLFLYFICICNCICIFIKLVLWSLRDEMSGRIKLIYTDLKPRPSLLFVAPSPHVSWAPDIISINVNSVQNQSKGYFSGGNISK